MACDVSPVAMFILSSPKKYQYRTFQNAGDWYRIHLAHQRGEQQFALAGLKAALAHISLIGLLRWGCSLKKNHWINHQVYHPLALYFKTKKPWFYSFDIAGVWPDWPEAECWVKTVGNDHHRRCQVSFEWFSFALWLNIPTVITVPWPLCGSSESGDGD